MVKLTECPTTYQEQGGIKPGCTQTKALQENIPQQQRRKEAYFRKVDLSNSRQKKRNLVAE